MSEIFLPNIVKIC